MILKRDVSGFQIYPLAYFFIIRKEQFYKNVKPAKEAGFCVWRLFKFFSYYC